MDDSENVRKDRIETMAADLEEISAGILELLGPFNKTGIVLLEYAVA